MKFDRFIPISKTDDEKRMVYGWASTPDLDSQGEIVAVDAIKRSLPNYMKFPTIREMHQPNAVGVTKETKVDSEKGLFIGAKVVDDNAWKKVKEGVFRGFSIGGRVKQKVDNIIQDLDLTEISLVDRPANSEAVITVFKADDPMRVLASVLKMDEDGTEAIDLSNAQTLLEMASHLAFIKQVRASEGKSLTEVNRAIRALKTLSVKVLNGENKKKFDSLLDFRKQDKQTFEDKYRLMLKTLGTNTLVNPETVQLLANFRKAVRQMAKANKELEKKEATEATKADDVKETKVSEDTTDLTKSETPEVIEDKSLIEEEKALERLEKVEAKLAKQKEEAEINKFETMQKSLVKVVSIVEKLEERLAVLEAQPAQPKTKASYVVSKAETTDEDLQVNKSDRLAEINKRISDLETMRNENLEQYQLGNHQDEARKLLDEKRQLQD